MENQERKAGTPLVVDLRQLPRSDSTPEPFGYLARTLAAIREQLPFDTLPGYPGHVFDRACWCKPVRVNVSQDGETWIHRDPQMGQFDA